MFYDIVFISLNVYNFEQCILKYIKLIFEIYYDFAMIFIVYNTNKLVGEHIIILNIIYVMHQFHSVWPCKIQLHFYAGLSTRVAI